MSFHKDVWLAGRFLAREYPVEADVVIGVPDPGLDAAMGCAEGSGILYGVGLVKNRYIGRTFITPNQQSREQLGADSLGFLSLDALRRIAPDAGCGFCDGCFAGDYPLNVQKV